MKLIYWLPICVVLNLPLFAQQSIKFDRYSLDDGLSQSVVLDITQDSTGFIWIATQDGLNRFDGYEFKAYKNNPNDSTTISDNWINVLYLDKENNLWLGTEYGGLNKFNIKTGKAEHFQHDSTNNNSLSNNTIRDIKEDKNGNLWIGTWGGGVSVFNTSTKEFRTIKNDPANINSISNNFIRTICIAKDGKIWIGTADGLNRYDSIKNSFARYYHKKDSKNSIIENFIVSLYEDINQNIWIGTRKGLNFLNTKSGEIKKFVNNPADASSFPASIILDIYQDEDSTFWVASYLKGIVKFKNSENPDNINFNFYKNENTNPKSISGNYVRKIFQDKNGIMWAGTWGSGLNKFNPSPPKFHHIGVDKNKKVSLSYPYVRSFMVDKNSNLWVGTHGKGIDVFNEDFTEKENENLSRVDLSGLSENTVFCMYEDSTFIWIATDDGLFKFNYRNKNISKIPLERIYNYPAGYKLRIKQILPYKDNFLLATSSGIAQYNPAKNTFYYLNEFWKDKLEIPGNSVNYMSFDKKGNLWVATVLNGIYKLEFENNEKEIVPAKVKIYSSEKKEDGLSNNKVNHICIDKKGFIWIGTNQGLNKLNPENNEMKLFLEEDGLPNNLIYGIIEDNKGNLWISTNNGLSKSYLENSKRKFRNYTKRDGLQSNEFNQASCYKSSNGTIYFGGINGFNYFRPEEVKDNQNLPEVEITRIKVLDKEINPEKLSEQTLEVSYSQNILSFTFAALEYTDPVRNKYKYFLEGFSDEWINSGNFRYATFTNLDPGEYKLKVMGSNNDGIWNPVPGSLGIIVDPPFYLTWWFKTLAAVLIISFFTFIFTYRIRNLLAIERLRTKIASDLHDEVGSALTKISINAGIINHLKNVEDITPRLQKIEKTSREITRTMSDVVWSIDSRNDTLGDLTDRMQGFVDSILNETEIETEFDIRIENPGKKLKIADRQNIYRIFKEAVNNAVKYSGTDKINIKIIENKKEFLLEVKDFGPGISENDFDKGNGLGNIKARANALGGKSEFLNDNGFIVRLTI